jgi:hypothetical protein
MREQWVHLDARGAAHSRSLFAYRGEGALKAIEQWFQPLEEHAALVCEGNGACGAVEHAWRDVGGCACDGVGGT